MPLKTSFRTHTCGEITEKEENKKVVLCGWVHSRRDHGKIIFLDLRDRYGLTQVVINPGKIKNIPDIKSEYVLRVEGNVKKRPTGTINNNIPTGKVELQAENVSIIADSATPAIEIDDHKEAGEEARLKYRYLDLRRPIMQKNLILRNEIMKAVRNYFDKNSFIEIETPLLVRSTPEGARDFIVPSRIHQGKFFALAQSPQLYKQILMIAGFDRYFQIARCLRDEDLRQDRQPEHTQIDFEMSFVNADDIMNFVEGMYEHVFKEVLNIKIKTPFPRISYQETIKKYKTDKPDLRKNKNDPGEYAFCWIFDFPLFAYNKQEKRWEAEHHMFTMPKKEHIALLEKKPGKVQGELFDIVLNGTEVGSGSIRINNPELQEKIMKVIGLSKVEANNKFGFLLNAYRYAGPVHGGMGLGFDRLVALMLGHKDIRESIAFPRTKSTENPMDESPSEVSKQQLKELGIKVGKSEN